MISAQEIQTAIFSVEQYIRDCEVAKNKHDTQMLKKWSELIFENKIKLQVLYYALGIVESISSGQLKKDIEQLQFHINELKAPREGDLFLPDNQKDLTKDSRIMELKMFTLRFIEGTEKKLIK